MKEANVTFVSIRDVKQDAVFLNKNDKTILFTLIK